MNLQDCVWENHYQIIMRTILQEEETIHHNIINCSKIYSLASSHKNSCLKAAVDKEWEKLEKIVAWDLRKSQKQIRGDR